MRVIAGDARGRPLKAPRGARTRPTSDLLRGAIFSMLASMGVRPLHVLDLYAGTGALGIEALSRGAGQADFVERDAAACGVIRENLERTGFAGRGRVHCAPARRALARLTTPSDLIFVDPPYADAGISELLELLAVSTLLGRETTLVYEHSRRINPPSAVGPLTLVETRTHGDSSVSFYLPAHLEAQA